MSLSKYFGALIGIEATVEQNDTQRGALIRKRALIGRRAFNGIITVSFRGSPGKPSGVF